MSEHNDVPWRTEPITHRFLSLDDVEGLAMAAYCAGSTGSFKGWDNLDGDEQERWRTVAASVVRRFEEISAQEITS